MRGHSPDKFSSITERDGEVCQGYGSLIRCTPDVGHLCNLGGQSGCRALEVRYKGR